MEFEGVVQNVHKRGLDIDHSITEDLEKRKIKRFKEGEEGRMRGKSLVDTINTGVCAHQGSRSSMEDVHRVILWSQSQEDKDEDGSVKRTASDDAENKSEDLEKSTGESVLQRSCRCKNTESKMSFFTVCDGHGGIQAADFVCSHIFNIITSQPCFEKDPEMAISEGFAAIEKAWEKYAQEEGIDGTVGTTVTVALIVDNVLYVANVGDSEAVLCSKGKQKTLTKQHVPSNPEEKERIEKEGGIIISDRTGNCRLGHPVWNSKFINIGVTRAVGDLYFKSTEFVRNKKSGLIAEPSIVRWELTHDDQFMIIASDGFWDVIKPEEATLFVQTTIYLDSNSICRALLELSKSRHSNDNITVLLIKFAVPKMASTIAL